MDRFFPLFKSPRAAALGLVAAACALAMHPAPAVAQAANKCGDPFRNHFGPFDYRTAARSNIELVEKVHFTSGVESMTQPATTTTANMASDVAYTLHVFPNHHRALITMMRLGERHKSEQPPGAAVTVECYFDRAVRFRPDDTVVRGIYAQYLKKQQRRDEAIRQLNIAVEKAGDNPISYYTIGAGFYDLGEFDRAVEMAHKARRMGYEKPALQQALQKSGHWKDDPAAAASAAAQSEKR